MNYDNNWILESVNNYKLFAMNFDNQPICYVNDFSWECKEEKADKTKYVYWDTDDKSTNPKTVYHYYIKGSLYTPEKSVNFKNLDKMEVNLFHPAVEAITDYKVKGFTMINVNIFPKKSYYSFLILKKFLPVYYGVAFFPLNFDKDWFLDTRKVFRDWMSTRAGDLILGDFSKAIFSNKLFGMDTCFLRGKEKNFEDWEAMSSVMTETIMKKNKFGMTKEMVDLYLRVRHDMICNALAQDLNIKYTGDTDMTKFNHKLTPDFLVEVKKLDLDIRKKITSSLFSSINQLKNLDLYLVMDVSVSDNMMEQERSKVEKYTSMCMDLNSKMVNSYFIYVPVHVCLALGSEMTLSKIYNHLKKTNEITTVISQHFQRIKDNEMYQKFKNLLNSTDLDQAMMELVNFFFPKIQQDKNEFSLSHTMEEKSVDSMYFLEFSYLLDPTYEDSKNYTMKIMKKWENSSEVAPLINAKIDRMLEIGKDSHLMSKHFCKLPIIEGEEINDYEMITFTSMNYYNIKMILNDKAILYKAPAHRFEKKERFLRNGMGFNKLILDWVEVMVDSFMSIREDMKEEEMDENTAHLIFDKMKGSMILEFLQKLARRIMMVANKRRSILNRGNIGIIQPYKEYFLEISPGPMITREKVITCRLIYKGKMDTSIPQIFNWKELDLGNCSNLKTTPWFTITLSDLEHYSRVYDKGKVIITNYLLSILESVPSDSIQIVDLQKHRTIGMIFAILMEHKRSTSTTLQMNRYIIMSMVSIFTDSLSLSQKLDEDPVWSVLQMYSMYKQMTWMRDNSTTKMEDLFGMINKLLSTGFSGDYDRLYMKSIYSDVVVEFKLMMDEMYLCNIFNKEHGFISHRVKAIMKKAAQDEMKFQNLKNTNLDKLMGNTSFEELDSMDDSMFCFHKDFLKWASMRFWTMMTPKISYYKIWKCMTETMDKLMTLKSSVMSVNYQTKTLAMTKDEVRSKTVDSQYQLCNTYKTVKLLSVLNYINEMEVIMGMFPKSQIGGPREILIQSYKVRPYFRLVENISKYLCSLIPEEMISKGKSKTLIQANIHNQLPLLLLKKKKYDVIFNVNRDHSHWAPATNLETFRVFFSMSDFTSAIKEFFSNFLIKMMNKRLFMPPALKEKWEKSYWNEADYELEWLKNKTKKESFSMIFNSGFGQGMMQSFSSLYHCMIKSSVQFLYEFYTKKQGLSTTFTSQISSDDNTDYMIISVDKWAEVTVSLSMYISINTLVSKMCNIHENLKKTGISFMVSEFNSQFMVVRRMMSPMIKFLYNSLEVVDYTMPEMAVRMHLANEKRVFVEGGKIPILTMIRELNDYDLKEVYRTHEVEMELMRILNYPEEIPFIFGFMPKKNLIPTLMFGPEVQLMDMLDSPIKDLVIGYYTSIQDTSIVEESEDEFWDMGIWDSNKITLETRLDKLILELRKKLMSMSYENLKEIINTDVSKILYSPFTFEDLKVKTNDYLSKMNRTYEMSDNMKMHSMVRALSLKTKGVSILTDKDTKMSLKEYCLKMLELAKTDKAKDVENSLRMCSSYIFMKRMLEEHELAQNNILRLKPIKMFNVRPKVRSLVFTENISFFSTSSQEIMNILMKGLEKPFMTRREQLIYEEFSLYLGNIEKDPTFTERLLMGLLSKGNGAQFMRLTRQFSKVMNIKNMRMVLESSQVDTFYSFFATIFRYRFYSTKVLSPTTLDYSMDTRPILSQSEVMDGLMYVSKDLGVLKELLANYIFFKKAKIKTNFFSSDSYNLMKVKFAVKCSRVKNLNEMIYDIVDRVLFCNKNEMYYYYLPSIILVVDKTSSKYKARFYYSEEKMDTEKANNLVKRAMKELDLVKMKNKFEDKTYSSLLNKSYFSISRRMKSEKPSFELKRKKSNWAIFVSIMFAGERIFLKFLAGEEKKMVISPEFFDLESMKRTMRAKDLDYFLKFMNPEEEETQNLLMEMKDNFMISKFYTEKKFPEVTVEELKSMIKTKKAVKESEQMIKMFSGEEMILATQTLIEFGRLMIQYEEKDQQLIEIENREETGYEENKVADFLGFSANQTTFLDSLLDLNLDTNPYMEGLINSFNYPLRENMVLNILDKRFSEKVSMPIESISYYSSKMKNILRESKFQLFLSDLIYEVEHLELEFTDNLVTRMAKSFILNKMVTKLVMLFGDVKKENYHLVSCNLNFKLVTYLTKSMEEFLKWETF